MKLKGKQKRYLRSQAHGMRPLFQVGKEGLTANWLKQVEDAIEKRELLKINVLSILKIILRFRSFKKSVTFSFCSSRPISVKIAAIRLKQPKCRRPFRGYL